MPQWKFYHNPQCGKCREALSMLQNQNVDIQVIEYLKAPLSVEELKQLIAQLNDPVSSLVSVKEVEFTEAPFDVNSVEKVAMQLSKKPRLLERPILQGHGRAAIGRPLEKIEALLK